MKQGMRIVIKPGAFFNQLQWSRNHWMLMAGFLVIGLVEMHVGRNLPLYQNAANLISQMWGVGPSVALGIVMAAKLGLLVAGSSLIAWSVWLVGCLFGAQSSRRVLFRRLSVVFMVALAGYTARHFTSSVPEAGYASVFLILWSVALGYFAIREQFGLNHLETAVLSLMLAFGITSSWKTGHELFAKAVSEQRSELTKAAPVARPSARRRAR